MKCKFAVGQIKETYCVFCVQMMTLINSNILYAVFDSATVFVLQVLIKPSLRAIY